MLSTNSLFKQKGGNLVNMNGGVGFMSPYASNNHDDDNPSLTSQSISRENRQVVGKFT